MKALKFLARGEKVKLKDLKLEKKILSKLFTDNSNIQSFSLDIYTEPVSGEHILMDNLFLTDGVEEASFIKRHHLITRKVSLDIVKIRGLEFAKLLEKDLAAIEKGIVRAAFLEKIERENYIKLLVF